MEDLRNIAIIAHVDHGKTTLVDELLKQSGTFDARAVLSERMMDSNPLEKERGITILAKNTGIKWNNYRINIIDTPGHADFGGEVERVLSMADCVLLVVDAVDGPMPQTRFVTQKAFSHGLRPIVVINKIDRNGARPDWVVDQVFDLFDRLGASDEQLDFPIVYTSALLGYACLEHDKPAKDMTPLFEAIVKHCPAPNVDVDGPFQMQLSSLDYNSFVGAIGIGRIKRGKIKSNSPVKVIDAEGNVRSSRIMSILGYHGLDRIEVPTAQAGDIITVTGLDNPRISDTICDPNNVEGLPPLTVDEPTVGMLFQVNTSPFAGKEGKFVTSRQIRDRLNKELIHNVALRVEDTESPDRFRVMGRGELHLSILIETMRREGYELAVSKPEVIIKEVDGEMVEPYENLTLDVEETHQGTIMEILGSRKGDIKDMIPDGKGRVRLDYIIPSRSLIGFHTDFLTITSGTGLMYHTFEKFGPVLKGAGSKRRNGVLIANGPGATTPFSLFNLQERGRMFIGPQVDVYEGMIIGVHTRDNDLVVNAIKGKQLTNMRASGTDENVILTPPLKYSLEQFLSFIEDDELVEITPQSLRLRKKFLKENERKSAGRSDN